MQYEIKTHTDLGAVLWMTHGNTQIGAALDYGIRIVHLSCCGLPNLFYHQPPDLSDGYTTASGWRLYGGHRFWLSPEGTDTYAPDNAPINYQIHADGVTLMQKPDPLLQVVKSLTIRFLPDSGIQLLHEIKNIADTPLTVALWGINTLAPGGTAYVDFSPDPPGTATPGRVVSLWGQTNLSDPRIRFEADRLVTRYAPIEDYCKIGLFSKGGKAVFENLSQRFTLEYEALRPELYSDLGCNFEVYQGKYFTELETLGVRRTVAPGEAAAHMEIWRLQVL